MEYLNESSALQEDAIEKYFCEPFSLLPRVQMTDKEAETFIRISFLQGDEINAVSNELEKKSWQFKAFKSRIACALNVKVDVKVLIFLLFKLESNIGSCVMYAYYMQYWAKKNNYKTITWDAFTMSMFPMGFPTNDSLHDVWIGQKIKIEGSDNLLDYPQAVKSILFDEEVVKS